jgi:hypothetical protein
VKIIWHIDPLLGGDREIGQYTAAVAMQRPENDNRRLVFSALSAKQKLNKKERNGVFCRSVPRCKQDN